MPAHDVFTPFRVALSGLVHTFRTQRHMRVHLYVTAVVVLLAVLGNLRTREILVLLFMITFVLVAEMFNSAIEATVDLVSPNYHPLAKFAKDISAGAVLITTMMAIIVGVIIAVGDDAWSRLQIGLTTEAIGSTTFIKLILGAFLAVVVVVIGKGLGKRGEVLRGGLVSGHSALGFFFAVSVPFIVDNALVSALAVFLAIIIAESRWEAKIHSLAEISLGAVVGTALALVLFGLWPK